ncbi:MAG: AMP-binding protein, partial [Deltaproteobacteria bacterium]|nr:AMP-binding protein [Deltaproteobacteria bacterium]
MDEITPPAAQRAIRARCFHPSGTFVEFNKEEIDQSIPERFEKIVRMYPERVAVKTRHHQFTYAELNRRANQVASDLLARSEKQKERIALLLENDALLMAAILGTLKAGKIYVPLDASLPKARITYMLDDSQATFLITNTKYLSFARELAQNRLPLINVDEHDSTLSTENPEVLISPDTLTWILHTSGSTGQPKGVVQNHRNVLQFVRQYTNGLHICADDRLTLLFSCSANGAAHDIFSALLNGASLYPFNVKAEPGRLAEWLGRNKLTIYCSVPTVFRYLLETISGDEGFPHLRLIKLIGEPVAKSDVEFYQRHFVPTCIFVNRLGSTETGTIRWHFIDKETRIDGNIVPVGYPVEDNEILLLDDGGNEVQPEDIGEIAVRSRYLTPGYWGRPEITETVFLRPKGDERVYRTGDLGRLLPDGLLLCLGRKDSQVKIRGYRVELAEIEMALLNLETIKGTVVVARSDSPEHERIVAYVVPNEDASPTVTELRHALAQVLPEHMIPSRFVFLDKFPLAPNGKVDRKALPVPDRTRPELEEGFVAPRTATEKTLATMWAKLLDLNQVGIRDNFVELGADSLQVVRLFTAIEEQFNVRLTISNVFEDVTIEQLAKKIDQASPRTSASSLVAIQPNGDKRPFFCVHELFGDIFCYMNLARHLGPDQPLYALQAKGLDRAETPFSSVEAMAAYYVKQIKTVQPEGPYALGGLSFGGIVAYEMAQQLRAKGEAVSMLALFDSHLPSGKFVWNCFRDFLFDFPSWLKGSLQLNRS